MIEALSTSGWAVAIDLLVEGFPERSRAFWECALANLQRYGGNADAGAPLGFLFFEKQSPAGVILTPAYLRRRADGSPLKIVNLSSWYVRPEQRWRAGLMLKSIIADQSVVYTDLTPTERVRQILSALDFAPINAGVELAFLPALALTGGWTGATRPADPETWTFPLGPDWAAVEAHRALGCVPLCVDGPSGTCRIVYRRARYRNAPAASLVCVESHAKLRPGMGALARHLLARGIVLLLLPAQSARVGLGSVFRPRDIWFAKGDAFADRTDVLGSELTLFGSWPTPG
jgi:hypothetical protein